MKKSELLYDLVVPRTRAGLAAFAVAWLALTWIVFNWESVGLPAGFGWLLCAAIWAIGTVVPIAFFVERFRRRYQ